MSAIILKKNPDITIGVYATGKEINLDVRDRFDGVDAYMSVQEACELIDELQRAVDDITGGEVQ